MHVQAVWAASRRCRPCRRQCRPGHHLFTCMQTCGHTPRIAGSHLESRDRGHLLNQGGREAVLAGQRGGHGRWWRLAAMPVAGTQHWRQRRRDAERPARGRRACSACPPHVARSVTPTAGAAVLTAVAPAPPRLLAHDVEHSTQHTRPCTPCAGVSTRCLPCVLHASAAAQQPPAPARWENLGRPRFDQDAKATCWSNHVGPHQDVDRYDARVCMGGSHACIGRFRRG